MRANPVVVGGTIGLLSVALACSTAPEIYQPTEWYYAQDQIDLPDAIPQIERGRPNAFLDGLNHYVLSLPVKLLLLNWELQDHQLPERNLEILEHYLALNDLRSVKVRHNEWDPIGEWRRMWKNDQVGVGYRATLGMIAWLRYTLFPDRVFGGLPIPFVGGGDHFNPFSNSVNVFSSDLGVLLHEAGHAKDYQRHEARGTSFVLLRLLPGIDLWQEATASQDALRYLYCIHEDEAELRGYRTLIPAYSTYIAGYFTGGLIVTLPIVGAGHVAGRVQAMERRRALAAEREHEVQWTRRDFLPAFCGTVASKQRVEDAEDDVSGSELRPSEKSIR
jgi:hypothetical protein